MFRRKTFLIIVFQNVIYIYVTISKRFKTVDKQVKSNSSVQLFLEVYYHQRIASHVYTRNIACGNKIFTFLKINEFDHFYKKN